METAPGLITPAQKNMSQSALLKTYNRFPVEFVKGKGPFLYDTAGNEYIDFLCGIGVTSFGHNHPIIKAEAEKQFNSFWHVSNLYTSSPQANLAKKLAERSGLDYVFFANTGTEAVEASIKFARKWGHKKNKYQIISTFNSFHGRTYGSLSATGQHKLWEGFEPLTSGFTHVTYNDIDAIKNAFNKDTVAVIIETIQGEGGINIVSENYLKELRQFCTEKDILLIIDEVQTGIGRTGKFYSYLHAGILPDIVASAKGLANGIPLGAAICSKKVGDEIKPGNHGSTFGGNPLAIASANAVVDLLDVEMLDNIKKLGETLLNALHGLHLPEIVSIRGKGLMIGVELAKGFSCKKAAAKMLDKGFLVGTSGDSVIRILPPFIITQNEIMKFLVALKKVISELAIEQN
jgi:acetylornithine/N-succinyldiaminopimelate aminotransferase